MIKSSDFIQLGPTLMMCDGVGGGPVSGDKEEVVLKRLRSILEDDDFVSGKCRSS